MKLVHLAAVRLVSGDETDEKGGFVRRYRALPFKETLCRERVSNDPMYVVLPHDHPSACMSCLGVKTPVTADRIQPILLVA